MLNRTAWVSGIVIMGIATLTIVLVVYFRFIVADPTEHLEFSVDQTGLFLQENQAVNKNAPDYKTHSLGLINRTYPSDTDFDIGHNKSQWERFANYIGYLNKSSGGNTQYKLFYMARHAEGWHNAAEIYYAGSNCWTCYWSQQDGNGTAIWKDAALTPKGMNQTSEANRFWKETAVKDKIPFPQIHYVSPMTRTMQTANYTWADNPSISSSKGFFVKEALRETMYECTCSQRHDKSYIREHFPHYKIDADMSDDDQLWKRGMSEPTSNVHLRAHEFLSMAFSGPELFISATSHGGIIGAILDEMGYPNPRFPMATSQNIPVLVRADKVPGKSKVMPQEPYRRAQTCGRCEAKSRLRRTMIL